MFGASEKVVVKGRLHFFPLPPSGQVRHSLYSPFILACFGAVMISGKLG